jgi:putative peptidoglycan lipid II flippase
VLDKHGRMGRFGEFYDQDEDSARPGVWTGPVHAGHGMLYDQDAALDRPRRDRAAELRRREAEDRQRDREIELRRERDLARDRDARRQRAREASRTQAQGPVRISSRPGATSSRMPPANPPPGRSAPQVRISTTGDGAPAPAGPGPDRSGGPTADAGAAGDVVQYDGGRSRPQSTQEATAVLAVGTFASRLTGFVRVLAIGYVLGVGSLSDAYNYANGVPNIVYDLLLGGILSATLIPVFVDQFNREDREETVRAISAVVTAIVAALAVITALLWLLAPWVIRFYLVLNSTPSAPDEKLLATKLLHYFTPQVFLLGAIVVSTALLNARHRFTAAALSPVLNNLIAIGALLATKFVADAVLTSTSTSATTTVDRFAHDQRAILILGLGTTAGYLAQLLVQLPAMRRAGIRIRLVWDLHHPAVRRVAALSTWLVGVVLANQISLALVMVLAGKTTGGVTAYNFSYQFFQLPYALIAVSVATAIMPNLAQRWTDGDRGGFERQLVSGLRVTLALLIPAALVYVAIAQPFIQLAIHHGRVTQSGAHLVSTTLAVFAAGLPGFSAFFLLIRAYQAMQKARNMFWIYALENAMTVVAALILEPFLGVPGLALAWVGPYTIVSFVAAADLRRWVGPLGGSATARLLVRVVIASAITGLVVVLIGLAFPSSAGDGDLIVRLLAQAGAGVVVYLLLAHIMRIRELQAVTRMARSLVGAR